MYSPPLLQRPDEITIHMYSYNSIGWEAAWWCSNPSSQNWIAANVAVFLPFWIAGPITFTKVWWLNGSAVTGNIDVGIFDTTGNVLASSGSTGQTGTTIVQAVDITDLTLARGTYYMGMVSDTSAVGQKIMSSAPAAGICQALGLLEQASVTLPFSTGANPATFAKYTRAFVPLFGLLGRRILI